MNTGKNGEKHGTWITWDDKGQKISEEIYDDGKENGTWTVWYSNGNKKQVSHISINNFHEINDHG